MPTGCLFSFCGFVQSFGHGIFFCWCLQSGKGFEVRDVLQWSFRINVNVSGQMALPMTASMLKGHYAYFRGCVCHQRQHPFFRWHFITHRKGMNTVEIHLTLDPGKSLNHIFHHAPFCLMNLYGEFILSDPFPDASKSRNQIGGFENSYTKPWSTLFIFFVRVSFSSKENLVRNWFPGTKTPGWRIRKKREWCAR